MSWFDNMFNSKHRVFSVFNGKNIFQPDEYGRAFTVWAHQGALQRIDQIKDFEMKDASHSYIRLMMKKPVPLFACLLAINLSAYYVDAVMQGTPSDILDEIVDGISKQLSTIELDHSMGELIKNGFRDYYVALFDDMKSKNEDTIELDTGMLVEKVFIKDLWNAYSIFFEEFNPDFDKCNDISLILEKDNIGRIVIMLSVMHTFTNLRGEMNVKFIP